MKKLFGLLTFILIGLINFGFCDEIINIFNNNGLSFKRISISNGQTISYSNPDGLIYCFQVDNSCNNDCGTITTDNDQKTLQGWGGNWTCTRAENISIYASRNIAYYYYVYISETFAKTFFPDYSSLQCQTEYNLIPIESVDSEYCEINNLCPVNTGSVSSGENWSALYINNLQFPGKSNIFVTIPDYIYWDYSSDDSDFNLYVGSGYDQDYIDNIVKINSYQPNSEDFTEIFVGGLTWIMPYIVIVLFIVFVRKLLKRIFR